MTSGPINQDDDCDFGLASRPSTKPATKTYANPCINRIPDLTEKLQNARRVFEKPSGPSAKLSKFLWALARDLPYSSMNHFFDEIDEHLLKTDEEIYKIASEYHPFGALSADHHCPIWCNFILNQIDYVYTIDKLGEFDWVLRRGGVDVEHKNSFIEAYSLYLEVREDKKDKRLKTIEDLYRD